MTNVFSDEIKKENELENSPETSSPLDGASDTLASDQLSAEQQKFLDDNFKKLEAVPLSQAIQNNLRQAISSLEQFIEEIHSKRVDSVSKKNFIKEKIDELKSSGKVNIDDNEFQKSETSVQEFVQLLDRMTMEISKDIRYYSSFLSDNPPSFIYVLKHQPDSFELHISNRIAGVKKYVKEAKRDLMISFSRYSHGFDGQIRQILYIEQVVRNMKKSETKQ